MLTGKELRQITEYQEERINLIKEVQTGYDYESGAKIVLQIIPEKSLQRNLENFVDIQDVKAIDMPPFMYDYHNNYCFNMNGFFTLGGKKEEIMASTQLFRNGIIEGIDTEFLGEGKLPGLAFENCMIRSIKKYIELMKKNKIEEPIYIFLTFIGCKGVSLDIPQRGFSSDSKKLKFDVIQFPYVYIDDYSVNMFDKFKALFDIVYNSFGFKRSFNYDESGNRIK